MHSDIIVANLQRVSADHILDLYTGNDENGKECIVLLFSEEPTSTDVDNLKSTQLLETKIRQRSDGKYTLTISLKNNETESIFQKFVDDLVESSSRLPSKFLGLSFVGRRYAAWQHMFKTYRNGSLSEAEIKGLIGELLFLQEYMIPHYGAEKALKSWVGQDGTDQDFIAENTWYEIKTTGSGNFLIQISSLEQLDVPNEGHLVVMNLDQTSETDDSSITLKSLVNQIKRTFEKNGLLEKFEDFLISHGVIDLDEYNRKHYKYVGRKIFLVDAAFPALRRSKLEYKEIINASYVLDVSNLREEENE